MWRPASSVALSVLFNPVDNEPLDPTTSLCPLAVAAGPAVHTCWGSLARGWPTLGEF